MSLTMVLMITIGLLTPLATWFAMRATLKKLHAETRERTAAAEKSEFELLEKRLSWCENEIRRLNEVNTAHQDMVAKQRAEIREWEARYTTLLLDYNRLSPPAR